VSNVIDLASRRVDRIVIEAGIVKSADPDLDGRRTYWLEYQPADGGACITWQGASLSEARRAAAEWVAGGAVISDRTGMPA
jgi:hypothetical protein